MAKRKLTTKSERIFKEERKRGKDDAMIALCVDYAQCAAAQSAGFAADPDGNSKFAGAAASRLFKRMKAAIQKISSHRATTAEGLNAKARVVAVVMKESEYGKCIDKDEVEYVLAFARDVQAHLEAPLVAAHVAWMATEDARRMREAGK